MAATMQDVADRAGVSIATVSFVVNNTKNVTPETRARIEPGHGRSRFPPQSGRPGAGQSADRGSSPWSMAALDHGIRGAGSDFVVGAAREASESDYHLVVYPDDAEGSQLPALVGQGLVDGLVLMEVRMEDQRVPMLTEHKMPFTLIGRTRDHAGLYCVDIDFDTSMALAIEHLVALGHRRIVYVPSVDPGEEQLGRHVRTEAAYRRLAKRHRIPPVVMPCRSSVPDGRDAAARLALEAPTPPPWWSATRRCRPVWSPACSSVASPSPTTSGGLVADRVGVQGGVQPAAHRRLDAGQRVGSARCAHAAPPARGRAAGGAGAARRSPRPG